jgi:hypothetical protein
MASALPGDPPADPASRFWWAIPAIGVVLLAVFAMVFGSGPKKVDFGTSYDAASRGSRAAYLVLEELGYPVERSRRAVGGDVRWLLFPSAATARDAAPLRDWIRRGGIILLAVDDSEFAQHLGLKLAISGNEPSSHPEAMQPRKRSRPGEVYPAEAPDVKSVRAGNLQVEGPPAQDTWGTLDGRPLVSVYREGAGEIWLLNRPDVFTNANLQGEDNAVLLCRLADAMLDERPGRIAFDEFCHGLRDRPSVGELLFRPPALAATLEVLFLTCLALWHFGMRFGPVRSSPPPARRAKEEFLDAMTELLARHGDRGEAFRTIRDEFLHRLQVGLGLPAGASISATVEEAVRRRGLSPEPLRTLLAAAEPPAGRNASAFLAALHHLDDLTHELSQPRKWDR